MVSPTGREQAYRSEREALDALEMALLQLEHAAQSLAGPSPSSGLQAGEPPG